MGWGVILTSPTPPLVRERFDAEPRNRGFGISKSNFKLAVANEAVSKISSKRQQQGSNRTRTAENATQKAASAS